MSPRQRYELVFAVVDISLILFIIHLHLENEQEMSNLVTKIISIRHNKLRSWKTKRLDLIIQD